MDTPISQSTLGAVTIDDQTFDHAVNRIDPRIWPDYFKCLAPTKYSLDLFPDCVAKPVSGSLRITSASSGTWSSCLPVLGVQFGHLKKVIEHGRQVENFVHVSATEFRGQTGARLIEAVQNAARTMGSAFQNIALCDFVTDFEPTLMSATEWSAILKAMQPDLERDRRLLAEGRKIDERIAAEAEERRMTLGEQIGRALARFVNKPASPAT